MNLQHGFHFELPDWLITTISEGPQSSLSDEQQMALVIELSRKNIGQGGGPFAALVINRADMSIVGAGVNLVTSRNLSCAHAEIVAISMAQQNLDCYRLSDKGDFQLVTSCEPCAMCFGAIPWSGVNRLLCGASKQHAEAIGFDEGPKLDSWVSALEMRGIEVETGILEAEAAAVLAEYAQTTGLLY